ncbi:hypothetical protein BDB00DRAFT_821775 [Zychaea mexicana]|uniref:uncharacterized protein n=1 Tax=Zychaea mexicana TaxID=64656 RepID=UPI0022FF3F70|nr:uncharacterized protein BDB00DRAFT_821775 [Zychaea mexicana]KAI9493831.1 hypothetical protein BDB00DRAFT_821775 [Zychaea mexicana]
MYASNPTTAPMLCCYLCGSSKHKSSDCPLYCFMPYHCHPHARHPQKKSCGTTDITL